MKKPMTIPEGAKKGRHYYGHGIPRYPLEDLVGKLIVVEGADGSGTSSTAIRAKIRKLVRDEDPENPLNDGRIAQLLSGEGIPVARRTVAKYREAMGIPASSERRRAAANQL